MVSNIKPAPVLGASGSMENPDNSGPISAKDQRAILAARLASLKQQADSLALQRRAVLTEAAEIEKILDKRGSNTPRKESDHE